jgi:inward rectifier potassium channel
MVSAVFFAVSALVPVPYTYVPWALGLLAILTAPGSDPAIALGPQFPRDQEHLSERFGLLTLLVLGVSFGHVLTSLTGLGLLDPEILLKGALTLMLTVSLWWIYFDDVAGSDIAKGPGNWMLWLMGHLPLTLSIIGVGVAAKDAIHMDLVAPASEPSRWFLSGALATTLMSVALIDSVTTRENTPMNNRHRVFVRLGSALILLLLGAAGGTLSSGAFLAFVTAVCAVQSLIDMMFTPMDNTPETVRADSVTELYPQRRDGTRRTRKAPPKFSDVVRKGAPSHLRRDVYFFFIEGSWSRLLACFAFAFTCLNIFFACVYQLQPGSIGGDSNQSFADAFFFSVQTLSSLGYGAMSPATAWADMVVTIEAPTGMLFVALATGLIFAKASKPQSSVLFSESLVISRRNGVPTLMLRVANARGNDVADATMTVSALIEEVSPEGHHLRRLHDLKLVRDRSPIFSMTWLAMHELDENSPLKSHNIEDVLLVVVTLVGHDGTYGQTTFARHTYDPSDVRMGHRFVDVMSELPDGRMMIDLTRFHDTQQESTP